eukprot:scaffold102638_cov21-Prasinocladus_malaysianus.AAC.2
MLEHPRHGTPADCRNKVCYLTDGVIAYAKESFGRMTETELISVLYVPTSLTNFPFIYQARKGKTETWHTVCTSEVTDPFKSFDNDNSMGESNRSKTAAADSLTLRKCKMD